MLVAKPRLAIADVPGGEGCHLSISASATTLRDCGAFYSRQIMDIATP
jgi:hypothetical protein